MYYVLLPLQPSFIVIHVLLFGKYGIVLLFISVQLS